MAMVVVTPWTPRQILNMYDRQAAYWLHPYTCGGGGGPCSGVTLIVTRDGLRCPGCNRLQRSAHQQDLDGEFLSRSPHLNADRRALAVAEDPGGRPEPTVEYTIELTQEQTEQLFAVATARGTTVVALLRDATLAILAADG